MLVVGPVYLNGGDIFYHISYLQKIPNIPIWVEHGPQEFINIQLILHLKYLQHVFGIRVGVVAESPHLHGKFVSLLLQAPTQHIHLNGLPHNLDQHEHVIGISW